MPDIKPSTPRGEQRPTPETLSPETAAEMEHLRKDRDAFRDRSNAIVKTNQRLLAEVQESDEARLRAENETRTVTRSLNAMTGRVTRAEQRRAELEAVLGTHRADDRAEIERLTKQAAELELLVQAMCDALNGHDCPDPNEGPMQTVTRVAVRLMEAERRVAELEAAAAPELTVYRVSHKTIVEGLYATVQAAREHCEAHMRRDPTLTGPMNWVLDEPDEDDSVEELSVGGVPTGYVVTPLTVAADDDPEADQ